jgi:hypothetical protein
LINDCERYRRKQNKNKTVSFPGGKVKGVTSCAVSFWNYRTTIMNIKIKDAAFVMRKIIDWIHNGLLDGQNQNMIGYKTNIKLKHIINTV